ncbi:6-phosphofructokinase [Candidatus Atribacteria bacterium 1244-E10-H5-B2]|nr:MAG: 6-phosphofructokinase [Candidatus Atribacteria bacterium 1244-E10-H5-B2]
MIKRVGILTGGGDCSGLNPTIRGAVYRAQDYNYEVYGIQEGWRGLVKGDINPLNLSEVREIIDQGGTILGTSRLNPYKIDNGIKQVLNSIKKLKLDAIIAIGGEDTLGVANRLFKEENVKLVGSPKTMDNDLSGTDYTFGFDSSVTWAIIPEKKADIKKMCQHLKEVYKKNKYASVVISEGATLPGINVEKESLDQFGHMILRNRGVGNILADLIKKNTGIETRHAVIGHIQRGGSPTLFDRILGLRCGVTAVDLIAKGKFGYMAALKGSEVIGVPLEKAVSKLKVVDKKWWKLAQVFFE